MTYIRWPVKDSGGELDDAWCADEGCWVSVGEAMGNVIEKTAERYQWARQVHANSLTFIERSRDASRRGPLERVREEMFDRLCDEHYAAVDDKVVTIYIERALGVAK